MSDFCFKTDKLFIACGYFRSYVLQVEEQIH